MIVPKRLRSEVLGRHVVFDVRRHRVQFSSESELDVYTLEMPDWCTIVALTTEGQVVLVRQHRHGVDDVMLETAGRHRRRGERALQQPRSGSCARRRDGLPAK